MSIISITLQPSSSADPDCTYNSRLYFRFDEQLKSGLELWLSHGPLSALADSLRFHLLVASRQPATMGLAREGNGVGTLVAKGGPPRGVSLGATNLSGRPGDDSVGGDAEEELDTFSYGD